MRLTSRNFLTAAAVLLASAGCQRSGGSQLVGSVTVSVAPSPAATDSCATVPFAATVAGTGNQDVTWSIQEGAAGGTITAAGVYTAPATAGTYHVVASSAADPSRTAVAPVSVTDRVLSVVVSPPSARLAPGATAQLTATVTTTCGSFVSTAAVAAPR